MTTTSQLDTAEIRKTLDIAFDDSGLSDFCLDYFPKVFDRFSQGMRKNEKIRLLLAHCRRHPTGFERLLDSIDKEYNWKPKSGTTIYPPREELKPLIDALSAYIDSLSQIADTTKDEVKSDKKTHSSSLSPQAQAALKTLKTCFQRNHPQILAALQAEQHHETNHRLHTLYRAFLTSPPNLATIRSVLSFFQHNPPALRQVKILLQEPTLQRLVRRGGEKRRQEYERMVFGRG